MFEYISNPVMSSSARLIPPNQPHFIVGEEEEEEEKEWPGFWQYFNKPTAESVARKVPEKIPGFDSSDLPSNNNRYFEDEYPGFYEFLDSGSEAVSGLVDKVSGSGVSGSAVPPSVVDYVNADLAQHYGMNRTTAYQEALANTAYQRAIKDMKAAGLNPAAIFGNGRASGASGVSGASSSGVYSNTGLKSALGVLGGLIGVLVSKSPSGYYIGQSAGQGLSQVLPYLK